MPGWTFAELWEAAADHLPQAPFAKQGDRTVTWAEADRRADGIARTLLDAGASKQDKVAQYTSTTRPSTSRPCSPASRRHSFR